jgi:hypothetical protein
MAVGPDQVIDDAVGPYVRALKEDIAQGSDQTGWKEKLMEADYKSTRQFFRQ